MDLCETGEESVVSVNIGCQPSFSSSGETIVQTVDSTFVVFQATSFELGSNRTYDNLGFALVECTACRRTQFGYPIDEGLDEHPLYNRGLSEATGISQVLNSSWATSLGDQMEASARRIWRDHYNEVYSMLEVETRRRGWKH